MIELARHDMGNPGIQEHGLILRLPLPSGVAVSESLDLWYIPLSLASAKPLFRRRLFVTCDCGVRRSWPGNIRRRGRVSCDGTLEHIVDVQSRVREHFPGRRDDPSLWRNTQYYLTTLPWGGGVRVARRGKASEKAISFPCSRLLVALVSEGSSRHPQSNSIRLQVPGTTRTSTAALANLRLT